MNVRVINFECFSNQWGGDLYSIYYNNIYLGKTVDYVHRGFSQRVSIVNEVRVCQTSEKLNLIGLKL